MNKQELERLYKEKLWQMEAERNKLGDMFVQRVSVCKPLTDAEILKQNECCGNIGLEIQKLKDMLEEFEE